MVKNEKNLMSKYDIQNFDKIKPGLLEINKLKKIYFKKSSYYGFGWSHNFDKQGIWSYGKLATLLFNIEPINPPKKASPAPVGFNVLTLYIPILIVLFSINVTEPFSPFL